MSFVRWIPTFLGFPAGGLLVAQTIGSIDDPLTGAAGGTLAGAVLGAAQWLALRTAGGSARWIAATAVGLGAGSALAAALTGSETDLGHLVLGGLVAGTVTGVAQAPLLDRDRRVWALWAGITGAAWALGWLTTTAIGVDVESGYVVFGSSGALVATVLTGLALRRLRGPATATQPTGA